ncbi:MAG: putative Ig domain-containing protein [Actinomycetota bacterium]
MRRYTLMVVIVVLGLSVPACHARPRLAFSPARLPAAQAGQPYEVSLVVSKNQTPVGSIYVAEGKLPLGLTLAYQRGDNAATLSGTPRAAGRYAFTVAAWCLGTNVSGQTGERAYTLVVT